MRFIPYARSHTQMDIWSYLERSGTICSYLGLSGTIWSYLGLSGYALYAILYSLYSTILYCTVLMRFIPYACLHTHKCLSGAIWSYLKPSGAICIIWASSTLDAQGFNFDDFLVPFRPSFSINFHEQLNILSCNKYTKTFFSNSRTPILASKVN